MMRPERRRRIIVVACATIALIVAGVAYVLVASDRVQDRIETRSEDAAAEVADFSVDSAARLLPVPSVDTTESDPTEEAVDADETPSTSTPTPDIDSDPPTGFTTGDEPEPTTESTPTDSTPTDSTPTDSTPVDSTLGPGATLFVNRVPGDDYGRLGIRNADGTRSLRRKLCARLHVAGGVLSCLESNNALLSAGILRVFTLR